MKKPIKIQTKEFIIMLILGVSYSIAVFVSGSACAFAYFQPKEPENLHIFLERRSERL